MLSRKGSNYEARNWRKDAYHAYQDDGMSKDIGPPLTTIKDEVEDDDEIDSPLFPAAFSPTPGQQNGKIDLADTESLSDLYAKVIPKSQRPKLEESMSEDDAPATNGEVNVDVDTNSDYAKVVPKSQRQKDNKETANKEKPATKPLAKPSSYALRVDNGVEDTEVIQRSDKQKSAARSKVLSAIGNQPIAMTNGDEVSYRQKVSTANRITSALGNGVQYKASAEL